ncbi:hypothetical protein AAFC00_004907 [Neodothiora populina]|uniref:Uncharacterized protein n=1 Tax=Neodothiora populina TaxID=2781224 RepID=A0ABR3P4E3_9PEZI
MTVDDQNRLPPESRVIEAGELPVFDSDGKPHKFRSLWDRREPTERRNIIVFIRHFFCGMCQEYVRALSSHISPAGLYLRNPPTTLTIIGCGDPSLINDFIRNTNCKYDVFTDPTRALHISLGMTSSLALGDRKPDYIKQSFLGSVAAGVWQGLSNITVNPGKKSQNGGEWIFVDGDLKWCRRMRHTRDHTEIEELKKILDSQKETGDRDGKYAEVYRDSMAVDEVYDK